MATNLIFRFELQTNQKQYYTHERRNPQGYNIEKNAIDWQMASEISTWLSLKGRYTFENLSHQSEKIRKLPIIYNS